MASSYVNDLRLNEMATGDGSGTWGTTTNTNLELIAEAFSYGTEVITTNADTHATTIADGATDPGRALYLKYTGTLDSACTITIGPNTVSKVWIIENGTSGSQDIILSQGSGANITIPAGDTKVVYSDGAGAGAAFFDAFASLSVVDLKVQDDLTVTGDIDVDGTTNLDVVDIDGAVNMATTALVTGVLTTTATQVATGGITSGSDIISDTDSTDSLGSTGVRWLKGWFDTLTAGTLTVGSGSVTDSSGAISFGDENLTTTGIVTAAGTSVFTNLDISGDIDVDGTTNLDVVDIDGAVDFASTTAHAGDATFADNAKAIFGAGSDLQIYHDGSNTFINEGGTGSLYIQARDLYLRDYDTSASFINMLNNGAVTLHHAGNAKLATTATGIDVTGTATMDGLTVDAASGSGGAVYMRGGTYSDILYATGIRFLQPSSTTNANRQVRFTSGNSSLEIQGIVSSTGADTADVNLVISPNGGNVGIGCSPGVKLAVAGTGTIGSFSSAGLSSSATLQIQAHNGAGYDARLYFECPGSNSGGITYERANSRLYAYSQSEFSGPYVTALGTSWTTGSDIRLKTNIEDINYGITSVMALSPKKYNYINNADKKCLGFIAQEVINILPELIDTPEDSETMMGIEYQAFIPVLVKAIQEQQALIESLEARITTLEG
jgi:hypothetical protein